MDSSTHTNASDQRLSSISQQLEKPTWKSLFLFTKRPHVPLLIGALVASAVTAGFKTALVVILGKVFNIIAGYSNGSLKSTIALSNISEWALILVGLGIGYWLANSVFLALWVIFGELQADSIRRDIFEALLPRNISWFDAQFDGIPSLLARIQTQTRELQLATSQILGLLASDIMTSLGSLFIAFYYSWKLTLVLLAILPISAIILSTITRKLEPSIQAQRRDLASASKYAAASIKAIDLVKAFNGYDQDVWSYSRATKAAARHYLVQARCNSLQMAYISFSGIVTFVVGFWYGIVLVNDGVAPGHIFATFYAVLASFQAIEAIMPQWLVIAKGMSAGQFLSTMALASKEDYAMKEIKGSFRPETCVGDIELRDITFTYPSNPEALVLNRLSFLFPAGDLTFVVGKSGSGKSTVGNLIVGFYEPTSGEVYINGHPLRALEKKWVRQNVTLIQQSSVLFDDSLFKNIALGHLDPEQATGSGVKTACEATFLNSTASTLPDGLDTNVGPRGHGLSGGQMQRVALARARIRDPPVLILDEITSGLDQVTKDDILESIRVWRKGKTTIIITHDVSQVEDDDFVYVMENSAIVEEGFKRDLIRRVSGPFSTFTTLTLSKSPITPIETNVESADGSNPCSPTTPPHTRPSPMSRLLTEELEGLQRNSLLAPGAILGHRLSWCSSTSVAFRIRTEHMWDAEMSLETSTPVMRSPPRLHNRPIIGFKRQSSVEGRERTLACSIENHCLNLEKLDHGEILDFQAESNTEKYQLVPANNSTTKNGNALQPMSLATILKTVWPALGARHRLLFILGMLFCIIGAGSIPTFAYCFSHLLSVMWSHGDKLAESKQWVIYLIVIATIDGTCTGGGRYLFEVVGQAWINKIRFQALGNILRQPKQWFEKSRNSPGRIIECLDRNAEEMRNIVGNFVPITLVVTLMISVALVWALAVSWKLTLIALSLGPVVMGAVKGFSVVSGKWEGACNKGAEDSSAILTEIFLNIRVVRALTQEGYFAARYLKSISNTFSLGMRRAVYTSVTYGLYQSLNYPLSALIFYYGTVLLAKEKEISATSVVQVVNLLLFTVGTATGFLSSMPQIMMAQATASQIMGYASTLSNQSLESQRRSAPSTPLPVRLHELSFSYNANSSRQVLRELSFEIQAGSCLAIVGRSGCGKSTVISLLLGLHSPTPRAILSTVSPLTFAGLSYSDVDIDHLRSMMAYVSQTPLLLPVTIAENITYGLVESSHLRHIDNITAAARSAGLHEFIMSLPEGYNTLVGDGGQTLSGGQAQRLSIARALARKPLLLVMDEPTSALDAESAQVIRKAIRELVDRPRRQSGGMAVVFVTHSHEMMAIADRIVMMEDGVKVEEGTYHALLSKRGRFSELLNISEGRIEKDMPNT